MVAKLRQQQGTGIKAGQDRVHPVSYFGLFVIPALPKSAIIQHTALLVHVFTGQWLVYGLILLHLTAAIWHVAVKRDGVLDRMLPPQNRDLRV